MIHKDDPNPPQTSERFPRSVVETAISRSKTDKSALWDDQPASAVWSTPDSDPCPPLSPTKIL